MFPPCWHVYFFCSLVPRQGLFSVAVIAGTIKTCFKWFRKMLVNTAFVCDWILHSWLIYKHHRSWVSSCFRPEGIKSKVCHTSFFFFFFILSLALRIGLSTMMFCVCSSGTWHQLYNLQIFKRKTWPSNTIIQNMVCIPEKLKNRYLSYEHKERVLRRSQYLSSALFQ